MRMLFLLAVLGFLFMMANKSPDETIQEAAKSMADKSTTMARNFLDAPTERPLTQSKPRETAPAIKQEKPKIAEKSLIPAVRLVKPSFQTAKPKTPAIKRLPQKTEKIERPSSPPSNVYGSPPVLKNERPQSQTPFKRAPEKTEKGKIGDDYAADTAKMPPSLPKATPVPTRPIPNKPEFSVPVNTERMKELRRRERELYNDTSRILMSIK